ncbi:MAG: DNA methylase [Oscillospiraceae bacterium]|nr:DNA methylase [Oscillospiraceae bacterium]
MYNILITISGGGFLSDKAYIAIDLKSFYASVECVDRGLDPLDANLVVADPTRTDKTICLAVSPSLKSYGVPGRPRLFEVNQKVREINAQRKYKAPKHSFTHESYFHSELVKESDAELTFITAPPRMAHYMEVSTQIYNVYLKYIAPEDIHVYSIDEVFIDATNYLKTYGMTPRELAMKIVLDVLETTGITATAGIGTNMYLCKVAMDIYAKHTEPDKNGVRIAELDEMSYRKILWDHRPLTDFWRIGRGYSSKLEAHGLYTMGDIARCSVGRETDYYNEELLYKLFGINAELLIDHAWGWEPTEISDIKSYRPENSSLSSGQVLQEPYEFDKARLVYKEMADLLSLDLVEKKLVTDQIVLTVGYDTGNLKKDYKGAVETDRYGRKMPKYAHGSENIGRFTASTKLITQAAMNLFDRTVDKNLLVRRMYIVANHVVTEAQAKKESEYEQLDFFTDTKKNEEEENNMKKEKDMQNAIVKIKQKYGKNAIIKGMNLEEGATALERNRQIGGHKA